MKKNKQIGIVILISLFIIVLYSCAGIPGPKSLNHGIAAIYINYEDELLEYKVEKAISSLQFKICVENIETRQKKHVIAYLADQVIFIYNLKAGIYTINNIKAICKYDIYFYRHKSNGYYSFNDTPQGVTIKK